MNRVIYYKYNYKFLCPCGKEMIPTTETTEVWKCPDKDCMYFLLDIKVECDDYPIVLLIN